MTAALREGRIYAKAPVIKESKADETNNADADRQVLPSTRAERSGKGGQETNLVDPNLAAGQRGGEPCRSEPQTCYGEEAGETEREECPQDVGAHFPIGPTIGPRHEPTNGNRIVCTSGSLRVWHTRFPTGLSEPDRAATAGASASGEKSASDSFDLANFSKFRLAGNYTRRRRVRDARAGKPAACTSGNSAGILTSTFGDPNSDSTQGNHPQFRKQISHIVTQAREIFRTQEARPNDIQTTKCPEPFLPLPPLFAGRAYRVNYSNKS